MANEVQLRMDRDNDAQLDYVPQMSKHTITFKAAAAGAFSVPLLLAPGDFPFKTMVVKSSAMIYFQFGSPVTPPSPAPILQSNKSTGGGIGVTAYGPIPVSSPASVAASTLHFHVAIADTDILVELYA